MKKIVSVIMSFVIIAICICMPIYASASDITPFYDYSIYPDSYLIISSNGYTQYEMTGLVRDYSTSRIFTYAQASSGQSGSPILNANNEAIGIFTTSYGVQSTGSFLYSGGVRFNSTILGFIQDLFIDPIF